MPRYLGGITRCVVLVGLFLAGGVVTVLPWAWASGTATGGSLVGTGSYLLTATNTGPRYEP
ncbi:MAG TPA: hypothetical protein VIJ09_04210, partial [Acidimicrobiales bacterium]